MTRGLSLCSAAVGALPLAAISFAQAPVSQGPVPDSPAIEQRIDAMLG